LDRYRKGLESIESADRNNRLERCKNTLTYGVFIKSLTSQEARLNHLKRANRSLIRPKISESLGGKNTDNERLEESSTPLSVYIEGRAYV
jgi:hypothetical protein